MSPGMKVTERGGKNSRVRTNAIYSMALVLHSAVLYFRGYEFNSYPIKKGYFPFEKHRAIIKPQSRNGHADQSNF